MLFNSFGFLFGFLPVTVGSYFLLARFCSARVANLFLVIASLVFYGAWAYEPAGTGKSAGRMFGYVWLLCGSTAANYCLGSVLQRRKGRWLLAIGVTANLLLLAYYKYSGFAVETWNALLGTQSAVPSVVLPLAISFYTFTQIAFLVDASRGQARELSFARYCLFVFFFPHLIAGPIVHHSEIMPQFARPEARRWNPAMVSIALAWLSLGLFKKVAIADSCAPFANAIFAQAASVSIFEAWLGALAYAFQLYFDFSGYSDMAIGLGLFFNVRLPDNFNAPYRAASIVEFWRRWHITLSRFLRDYLYFPLGGNRLGGLRRYLNLFVTMLLGGIWHGAGWTFLLWGAYHGLLLVACHLWQGLKRPLPTMLARVLTLIAVLLGWVLFRAKSLPEAQSMFSAMFGFRGVSASGVLEPALWLGALLAFVMLAPTTQHWVESRRLTARHGFALAVIFCVALLYVRNVHLKFSQSEFIYFQF